MIILLAIAAGLYILAAVLVYRFFGGATNVDGSMLLTGAIFWPLILWLMLAYYFIKLLTDGVKGIIGDGE